jgi:hypothetical protein
MVECYAFSFFSEQRRSQAEFRMQKKQQIKANQSGVLMAIAYAKV